MYSTEPSNSSFLRELLRIHWRRSTTLKTSKKLYKIMILTCNIILYFESVFNTLYIEKKQMLQKFSSDKINRTENALFFFHDLQFITVLLLICDSYMSWSTRFVSVKLCLGFSIFDSVSFLLKLIFLFNKMHGLFDFGKSKFWDRQFFSIVTFK